MGSKGNPTPTAGPAEFKVAHEGLLNVFPDSQVEVEDTAADGDHVVVRWRARGADLCASLGMPATGRPVDFRGMTWLTFRSGVIVEGWDSWNLGGSLESLKLGRENATSQDCYENAVAESGNLLKRRGLHFHPRGRAEDHGH